MDVIFVWMLLLFFNMVLVLMSWMGLVSWIYLVSMSAGEKNFFQMCSCLIADCWKILVMEDFITISKTLIFSQRKWTIYTRSNNIFQIYQSSATITSLHHFLFSGNLMRFFDLIFWNNLLTYWVLMNNFYWNFGGLYLFMLWQTLCFGGLHILVNIMFQLTLFWLTLWFAFLLYYLTLYFGRLHVFANFTFQLTTFWLTICLADFMF